MLSSQDKKGLWIMAGVVLALIAMLAAYRVVVTKAKPGVDLCVGKPIRSTVILVDHSETVSDQTREETVTRAMRHIKEVVQVNERVSVFAINELGKKSLRPLVSLCKPPQEGNQLVESPRLIERHFLERFQRPMQEVLSRPIEGSDQSPIAQAIADLATSDYLRGTTNHLLVFSDMIEHTGRFSLYKCHAPERVVAEYRATVKGAVERPTFTNTSISVSLIPRRDLRVDGALLVRCRDTFWPWFFGDNTGPDAGVRFDLLPG